MCRWLVFLSLLLTSGGAIAFQQKPDGFHVFPGEAIQPAIEAAAKSASNKTVKVHAGTYRPNGPGQALIWLNRTHDGVRLEAVGEVTLSGSNPERAPKNHRAFPALVNHVVYFGDGISPKTEFIGFKVTGANDFFLTNQAEQIEPNGDLIKGLFFYGDGGGIKIFGRSYPVIRQVEVFDNYASPCAGGVSIEHDGHGPGTSPQPVRLIDGIFRNNRAPVNGAAVDLLPGSSAVLSNCLFEGNLGNMAKNYVDPRPQPDFTNAAVLCVFQNGRAIVQNCTLVNNRNGAHDLWTNSLYQNCIFWSNSMPGGFYTEQRFELKLEFMARVENCFIRGPILDRYQVISAQRNQLNPPAPDFDAQFAPRNSAYQGIGFRPWRRQH